MVIAFKIYVSAQVKIMKIRPVKLSLFILSDNFGAEIGHFISVPAKNSSSETKTFADQGAL